MGFVGFFFPQVGEGNLSFSASDTVEIVVKKERGKKKTIQTNSKQANSISLLCRQKMKIASQVISITCFAEGEPDKFSQASE